ncbi:MAG: hypothetical protein Q8M16_13860, partial [Pirellulaceae bacterium]|nr:hypothetical protein [Pirellulaceae bacterium]
GQAHSKGNHAVNREEFADDFHTSSLSTHYLVVFPAMQVECFAQGNDLEAKRTDRLAEILSTSSRRAAIAK